MQMKTIIFGQPKLTLSLTTPHRLCPCGLAVPKTNLTPPPSPSQWTTKTPAGSRTYRQAGPTSSTTHGAYPKASKPAPSRTGSDYPTAQMGPHLSTHHKEAPYHSPPASLTWPCAYMSTFRAAMTSFSGKPSRNLTLTTSFHVGLTPPWSWPRGSLVPRRPTRMPSSWSRAWRFWGLGGWYYHDFYLPVPVGRRWVSSPEVWWMTH